MHDFALVFRHAWELAKNSFLLNRSSDLIRCSRFPHAARGVQVVILFLFKAKSE